MHFQQKLRIIRIIIAILFFSLTSFVFIDIYSIHNVSLDKSVIFLQFIPSLIKFIKFFTISAAGFFIIILLTVLAGRVYCSTICPLGVLQDIFLWTFRKTNIIKKYKTKKKRNVLKWSILFLMLMTWIAGSLLLVNLLDPYSNFGRIGADIVRPYLVEINNVVAETLIKIKIYSLQTFPSDLSNSISVIYPFIFLVIIILFVFFSGRHYCNTICPVGTLLGLVSRISVFKIRFNADKCTACGSCVKACKAGCIDIRNKKLDFSRCVACFNCISVCEDSAIGYGSGLLKIKKNSHISINKDKRMLLKWSTVFLLSSVVAACRKKIPVTNENGLIPFERKTPVSPPGSLSLLNFHKHCTACHLCISACPTQVLQPAMFEYGWDGILQPVMDFEKNFCNYNCNICSQVCPSGAIMPVELQKKQRIQTGYARFIEQNCVVFTRQKDCGACSEHCPTKAYDMVPANEYTEIKTEMIDKAPYQSRLKIPKINTHTCIGCGACEYACPVIPDKAIIVEGNTIHLTAMEPKKEKVKEIKTEEDFPF